MKIAPEIVPVIKYQFLSKLKLILIKRNDLMKYSCFFPKLRFKHNWNPFWQKYSRIDKDLF